MSAVAKLLRHIEMLEELHTEVQGVISSPHLATTLLFDVSRRWIQYLNRCVAASASEVEDAPGASFIFSLEPILVNLEGGRYTSPIPPAPLGFYLVHLALLSIPYKMHSSCNMSGMFSIPTILSHTLSRFAIQDN